MKKTILSMIAMSLALFAATAVAGECINDRWQPTFVRHSAVAPTSYYYTGTAFIPVSDAAEAQAICRSRGVRDAVNGETCVERPWNDFGCACNIEPAGNKTCLAFQNFIESGQKTTPWRGLASTQHR